MGGLAGATASAVLKVDNYDRARRFYSEVLGLDVEDIPGDPTRQGVAKTDDGSTILLYERPGMPAPENTTLGFSVDDIDTAMDDLRSGGVEFEEYDIPEIGLKTEAGVASFGDMKIAWFKDSEGNILSLTTR